MNQKKVTDCNVLKKVSHWFFYGSSLLFMSFSAPKSRILPMPGKDKKDEFAKPIDPKSGTKNFVSLLPSTRTAKTSVKRNTDNVADIKADVNPDIRDFVENYIHYEKTDLTRMKVWAQPIFKLMDAILIQYNLPVQLKYVAVVESSLNKNMRMRSGATGPWQLMRDEGIRYGLIKNGHDYRTDYAKSTEAAAKLLTSLHSRYGDWLLVLAAYNAGVGRVNRAIAAAGSNEYWDVQNYLPAETRNYVKKFISTHYFFEGSGGLTTLSANELEKYNQQYLFSQNKEENVVAPETSSGKKNVTRIKGLYNKFAICKVLNLDLSAFDKANPNFDETLSNGQFYDMQLPSEKTEEEFEEKKDEILQQSFNQLLNDADNAASTGSK